MARKLADTVKMLSHRLGSFEDRKLYWWIVNKVDSRRFNRPLGNKTFLVRSVPHSFFFALPSTIPRFRKTCGVNLEDSKLSWVPVPNPTSTMSFRCRIVALTFQIAIISISIPMTLLCPRPEYVQISFLPAGVVRKRSFRAKDLRDIKLRRSQL